MTFEQFLLERGYQVESGINPGGEFYVINGIKVHHRDLRESVFGDTFMQYLAMDK